MRTEWVEILLVRTLKDPHLLSVEVEIFLPNPSPPDKQGTVTRRMPLDMIDHMQYLLRLLDVGFCLRVIGDEGLWLASKNFEEAPSPEILGILMPPSVT